MKKFLFILLSVFGFLVFLICTLAVILFIDPTIILKPKIINYAIARSHALKSWSYKEMSFEHKWIKWNHRVLKGSIKDFCFVKASEMKSIDACLNSVEWNVDLEWTKGKGLNYIVHEPLTVISDKLIVTTFKDDDSPPPDYFKVWDKLWTIFIPDITIDLKSVDLIDRTKPKPETKHFSLALKKDAQQITAAAMDFVVHATKNKIVIAGQQPMKIPFELKTKNPLYFRELNLIADIKKDNVPLTLTGMIDTAKVQIQSNVVKSWVNGKLPPSTVLKNILLETKGNLAVEKLKQTLFKLMKPPFNQLPAPINAMEGIFNIQLTTAKTDSNNEVLMLVRSNVDLSGAKQSLKFHLDSNFPFDVKTKKPGPFVLALEFEKVVLMLPKLEKNKLPPQFKPDSRFYRASELAKAKREKNAQRRKKTQSDEKSDLAMNLQAPVNNPLQIKTNLLDEILKLYFDLKIDEGQIQTGFVQTLPLNTTIFRRSVTINSVRFNFHAPVETDIVASIDFHLPEYTVTLKLEGPLSKPRTAFSSKPPLPEDDIIAVLLFGRPLNDLDADDKTASKKTNQIISQGLLSLSVLYFFAGSPIQSIGYDPESKEVSAQVGLGKKNSLRVTSEAGGVSGAGVRHSLGKGWYIDSSVQKSSTLSTATSATGNDYGVMLERIISY
jgi:hypothetical protein